MKKDKNMNRFVVQQNKYCFLFKLICYLFRRGTLLMNNSFTLVGALFMAVAERSSSFEMMILGRFLLGLHAGE